jgi:hypothetical protein
MIRARRRSIVPVCNASKVARRSVVNSCANTTRASASRCETRRRAETSIPTADTGSIPSRKLLSRVNSVRRDNSASTTACSAATHPASRSHPATASTRPNSDRPDTSTAVSSVARSAPAAKPAHPGAWARRVSPSASTGASGAPEATRSAQPTPSASGPSANSSTSGGPTASRFVQSGDVSHRAGTGTRPVRSQSATHASGSNIHSSIEVSTDKVGEHSPAVTVYFVAVVRTADR